MNSRHNTALLYEWNTSYITPHTAARHMQGPNALHTITYTVVQHAHKSSALQPLYYNYLHIYVVWRSGLLQLIASA